MLSGDNSILQRTTDAKIRTEKAQIIENAQTDILGQQTENKGTSITKEQLVAILNKYFNTTTTDSIPDEISTEQGHDLTLTTKDAKYTIMLSEIFMGRLVSENHGPTLGEKYDEYENSNNSMIGKKITYTANNESNWIIIGKNNKGNILITTENPVGEYEVDTSLIDNWFYYIENLNDACSSYKGKIGKNNIDVKNARSITLEDINTAVGFAIPETFDTITFGVDNDYYYPNESTKTWIKSNNTNKWKHEIDAYLYYKDNGTYKYDSVKNGFSQASISLLKENNIQYIFADNKEYWVASVSLASFNGAIYYNAAYVGDNSINSYNKVILNISNSSSGYGGFNVRSSNSMYLRPVVEVDGEIPYDDLEIGNYATY